MNDQFYRQYEIIAEMWRSMSSLITTSYPNPSLLSGLAPLLNPFTIYCDPYVLNYCGFLKVV